MSSSQSKKRTMVFTHEKNDTCMYPIRIANDVFSREKNDTSNQKPQRCVSFVPKFLPFIGSCSLHSTSQTFDKKSFSQSVFLVKKSEKHLGNWSGIVSFVLLSMKKTVGNRENNSGRRKTERDVSLSCAFYQSYFVFYLSLISLYSNRPFYLNSFIFSMCTQNKQLGFLVVLGLPHIITLIIFLTNVFTNKLILRLRCHFAVCSGSFSIIFGKIGNKRAAKMMNFSVCI